MTLLKEDADFPRTVVPRKSFDFPQRYMTDRGIDVSAARFQNTNYPEHRALYFIAARQREIQIVVKFDIEPSRERSAYNDDAEILGLKVAAFKAGLVNNAVRLELCRRIDAGHFHTCHSVPKSQEPVRAGTHRGCRHTRQRFRFPLSPLGFAIASSYSVFIWFPAFIVWVAKSLIVRFGGARLYRRFVPFFLGLALGHFFSAGVCLGIAGLWDTELATRYMVHFG